MSFDQWISVVTEMSKVGNTPVMYEVVTKVVKGTGHILIPVGYCNQEDINTAFSALEIAVANRKILSQSADRGLLIAKKIIKGLKNIKEGD